MPANHGFRLHDRDVDKVATSSYLATFHFPHQRLASLSLATYDERMAAAARGMGFALHAL